MVDQTFPNRPPLAVDSIGLRSAGFTGMALLILSEAGVFAYLFFAYFYSRCSRTPAPGRRAGRRVLSIRRRRPRSW
jgi:heme/copper-type cytochrome/quinol oxidase subunit 3